MSTAAVLLAVFFAARSAGAEFHAESCVVAGARDRTDASALPRSLVVPPVLLGLVVEMSARSESFRIQLRTLERMPDKSIVIGFGSTSQVQGDVARTQLLLRRGVLQRAEIWLRPVSRDTPEAIAHELEHVIEWLDGSGTRGPVARALDGTIETVRAIRSGRKVASELQQRAVAAPER